MIPGCKYNLLFKFLTVNSTQFLLSMNDLSSSQLTYDSIWYNGFPQVKILSYYKCSSWSIDYNPLQHTLRSHTQDFFQYKESLSAYMLIIEYSNRLCIMFPTIWPTTVSTTMEPPKFKTVLSSKYVCWWKNKWSHIWLPSHCNSCCHWVSIILVYYSIVCGT